MTAAVAVAADPKMQKGAMLSFEGNLYEVGPYEEPSGEVFAGRLHVYDCTLNEWTAMTASQIKVAKLVRTAEQTHAARSEPT